MKQFILFACLEKIGVATRFSGNKFSLHSSQYSDGRSNFYWLKVQLLRLSRLCRQVTGNNDEVDDCGGNINLPLLPSTASRQMQL